MPRPRQIVLIALVLPASWFGTQAIHELGHVFGAKLTGGRIERVVLNPLTISRTDLAENPHPLLVAWAGPLFGAVAPFLLWVAVFCAAKHGFGPLRRLLQFFAGFCLISNGLYISLGSFHHIGTPATSSATAPPSGSSTSSALSPRRSAYFCGTKWDRNLVLQLTPRSARRMRRKLIPSAWTSRFTSINEPSSKNLIAERFYGPTAKYFFTNNSQIALPFHTGTIRRLSGVSS